MPWTTPRASAEASGTTSPRDASTPHTILFIPAPFRIAADSRVPSATHRKLRWRDGADLARTWVHRPMASTLGAREARRNQTKEETDERWNHLRR